MSCTSEFLRHLDFCPLDCDPHHSESKDYKRKQTRVRTLKTLKGCYTVDWHYKISRWPRLHYSKYLFKQTVPPVSKTSGMIGNSRNSFVDLSQHGRSTLLSRLFLHDMSAFRWKRKYLWEQVLKFATIQLSTFLSDNWFNSNKPQFFVCYFFITRYDNN